MPTSNDLALLTIEQLFSANSHYVIPIYQRNYAWGAQEIEQLIRDIADAAEALKNAEQQEDPKYYLGSLVVYVRDGADSAHQGVIVYETIDGQQRYTTLSILLAYLKKLLVAANKIYPRFTLISTLTAVLNQPERYISCFNRIRAMILKNPQSERRLLLLNATLRKRT